MYRHRHALHVSHLEHKDRVGTRGNCAHTSSDALVVARERAHSVRQGHDVRDELVDHVFGELDVAQIQPTSGFVVLCIQRRISIAAAPALLLLLFVDPAAAALMAVWQRTDCHRTLARRNNACLTP